jgi:phosphate transport system substrate-binding protein
VRAAAALLAALATLAAAAPRARAVPTITMTGAPVAEALIADLAYFYRHAVRHPPRFALSGGGTGVGMADARRGLSDAGMVTRGLIPGDPRGLVLTRLALSGVCLVSNRANRVPNLTRAQIQGIVAARITLWSQVPGATRSDAIVPVDEDLTKGAAQVFRSVFVDIATPIAWHPVTLLSGAQVRDYVEQTQAALGYVDLALTRSLHPIRYEGVPCTRATVKSGRYPARRPIGVVTRGRPRGALRRFLRWARTSRTARRVIATRYIPVGR